MTLSDASLTDLVAELRERLRSFMAAPLGQSPVQPQPGPLSPAGRAALAARLLSVMLGDRHGDDAVLAARAFDELADALHATPDALPGSVMEAELRRLAGEFEDLALAWEAGEARDLTAAWRSLRDLGDRLWASTKTATQPAPPPPAPSRTLETPAPPGRRSVWLLVAGDLRRATLRRRLEAAGLAVVCLVDADAAARRLATERPHAVICDDAEPARFGSRLQRMLPPASPPVVVVHGRPAGEPAAGSNLWLPPFRTADLLDQLARAADRAT
jgi:hypothetical protein